MHFINVIRNVLPYGAKLFSRRLYTYTLPASPSWLPGWPVASDGIKYVHCLNINQYLEDMILAQDAEMVKRPRTSVTEKNLTKTRE